ncbi:hypothetical protein QUA74_10780 [Microcoleus sp. LAD1_D3]|uniref:hypothetical protein n=1 Tax=Microcoleus sp. LAD1_D3 TaxID=2819365 RepID=UPI002FD35C9E
MSLPYLTKIDDSNDSFIHPSAIQYNRPAVKLANRLRWDKLNIEPELQRLFRYYRNTCCLADRTQGFEAAKSPETYDKIGKLLAQMWSIDQLTEVKQLNYYSRRASL